MPAPKNPNTEPASRARREIGIAKAGDKLREAGEPVVMAMFIDEHGICRAWATGPARNEAEVKQHAAEQLSRYIATSQLAEDAFRLEVRVLDASTPTEV